jgi:hypothetical protein
LMEGGGKGNSGMEGRMMKRGR